MIQLCNYVCGGVAVASETGGDEFGREGNMGRVVVVVGRKKMEAMHKYRRIERI